MFLLSLDKMQTMHVKFAEVLARALQQHFQYTPALEPVAKEFHNSYKHHFKTKILQYLLVLLPLLKEVCNPLFK